MIRQLVEQGLHKRKYTVPLFILIHYWPGDKRTRDVPGMVDALWHVLQKVGFVEDDSQFKHVEWIEEEVDRDNPRVLCKVRMRERFTDPLYMPHQDQDEEGS